MKVTNYKNPRNNVRSIANSLESLESVGWGESLKVFSSAFCSQSDWLLSMVQLSGLCPVEKDGEPTASERLFQCSLLAGIAVLLREKVIY